jgi:chorismate mutase
MELKDIRTYLDTFDKALANILLHRMSLVPLVAYTKLRDGIEIYQPEREKDIFAKIDDFCKNSNMDKKMLVDIFRRIIDEAYVIEAHVLKNGLPRTDDYDNNVDAFFEKVQAINRLSEDIGILKFDFLTTYYKNKMDGD